MHMIKSSAFRLEILLQYACKIILYCSVERYSYASINIFVIYAHTVLFCRKIYSDSNYYIKSTFCIYMFIRLKKYNRFASLKQVLQFLDKIESDSYSFVHISFSYSKMFRSIIVRNWVNFLIIIIIYYNYFLCKTKMYCLNYIIAH